MKKTETDVSRWIQDVKPFRRTRFFYILDHNIANSFCGNIFNSYWTPNLNGKVDQNVLDQMDQKRVLNWCVNGLKQNKTHRPKVPTWLDWLTPNVYLIEPESGCVWECHAFFLGEWSGGVSRRQYSWLCRISCNSMSNMRKKSRRTSRPILPCFCMME